MTKDIILTISGLHATDGESDEPVEIITPGQYYFKNGKHYILFEEVMEGLEGQIKSTIKFNDEKMELIRNGAANVRMIFEKDREHAMIYHTPMGPLEISVYAEDVITDIGEDQINVQVDYSLKSGDQIITESTVNINICPKEVKRL